MRFLIGVSLAYTVITCHIVYELSGITLPVFRLYKI